jgi:hypothetical protein
MATKKNKKTSKQSPNKASKLSEPTKGSDKKTVKKNISSTNKNSEDKKPNKKNEKTKEKAPQKGVKKTNNISVGNDSKTNPTTKQKSENKIAIGKKGKITIPKPKGNKSPDIQKPDEEKQVTPTWSADKVFELKEEKTLCNGQFKIGKGVKLQRTNDTTFNMSGLMTDGLTPFNQEFPLFDKAMADWLYDELIEIENTPEPIAEEKKSGDVAIDAITTEVDLNSINPEPEFNPSELNNVPLSADNVKQLANHLPSIAPANNQPNTFPTVLPSTNQPQLTLDMITKNNEQHLNDYADTIEHHIMSTFQVRVRGGISVDEVNEFLKTCSKDYTYDIKSEAHGKALIITRDSKTVRLPRDTTKFLPII